MPNADPASEPLRGWRRVRTLWRLFRNERDDPAPFYRLLASELAADLEAKHGPLDGRRILDLGCGPGWYAEALESRGAVVVAVDRDGDELATSGARPPRPMLSDGGRLALPSASFDAVVCSNLLEHAPDTRAILSEIGRVLRPGGWAYVSWTNWYSPWGGHEMSPWHLLGPERGSRLYERRHGPPRKNRFGEGLFPVHIGPTLALLDTLPELRLERAEPRYWPWARPILAVPGLRELVTWNCVLRLRRTSAVEGPGGQPVAA